MDARTNRNADTVSAMVARRRGRARLRAATAAMAGAGLIGAGVIAYHLPSAAQTTTTSTASGQTAGTAANPGTSRTVVHATSGGSGVAASTSVSGTQQGTAPVASNGQAHVTSGGS